MYELFLAHWEEILGLLGVSGGVIAGLKVAAKYTKWVLDNKIWTLIKGLITGVRVHQVPGAGMEASDKLPPIEERGMSVNGHMRGE